MKGDAQISFVIDGDVSLETVTSEVSISKRVDGEPVIVTEEDVDCTLLNTMDGEVGVLEKVYQTGGETYTGPTVVTPTQEVQTLATVGKVVLQNIQINPIPQNYGLITWNGQKITVS